MFQWFDWLISSIILILILLDTNLFYEIYWEIVLLFHSIHIDDKFIILMELKVLLIISML